MSARSSPFAGPNADFVRCAALEFGNFERLDKHMANLAQQLSGYEKQLGPLTADIKPENDGNGGKNQRGIAWESPFFSSMDGVCSSVEFVA
jgi:hypothetical protein